jgi:hypothetical protein
MLLRLPEKKLLGVGTAELFVPKYLDYFERKRLINLAVKTAISEDHFYRFVDIMSDPAVDKGEEIPSIDEIAKTELFLPVEVGSYVRSIVQVFPVVTAPQLFVQLIQLH